MNEDSDFLRRILAAPQDVNLRLRYADWLEARGDERAEFARMDPDLERISYVAWLEGDGHLDYYLENFPEVKREAEERRTSQSIREQRRELGRSLEPEWVAFMNTLGCPFYPFNFFNNHGSPREIAPDDLPFKERIGTRGPLVVFESDFRNESSFDRGLMCDVDFLSQLKLTECAYGAATCPVHPFLCELKSNRRPLTGGDVLAALRPSKFSSRHVRNLDATSIPYPGYHPGNGTGLSNDEIHNDFSGQYVFINTNEETQEPLDELADTHGAMKRYVVGGQLWYVLLHTRPRPVEEYQFSDYVVLFAVGLSPHGNRLVGIVTHQVCHNLCD